MKKKTPLFQKQWYKLDNAAKIYPGQNTSSWSNVYRITAQITEKVDPELLEKALEMTLPRFPSLHVKLKNGFFWHYFETNDNAAPPVLPDVANPCQRMKFKEK